MSVRAFTFAQYHGKRPVPGSTKIRMENMMEHWDEFDYYKYGENPEAMIFQKVYCTYDYKFPKHFEGVKILDTCDPDWFTIVDLYIKETLDSVDAVTVPTESLQKLVQQMTDKKVHIVPDRFNIDEFPQPKKHTQPATKVVWFGYAHNSELMNYVIPSLENRKLDLLVISNSDPMLWKYANKPEDYRRRYTYRKYVHNTVYSILQEADICVLPVGNRPQDVYKSNNREITANLCGLPVVSESEALDKMIDHKARQEHIDTIYGKIKQDYDIKESIKQYKEIIDEIKRLKT